MWQAFIYGVILAFGLILPLGAQNIFIFNQGANQKSILHALPSVITASLCDTMLILCAVLGIAAAVLTLPVLKNFIFVIGFIFLMYIGWITWKSKPNTLAQDAKPLSAKQQIIFAISASLLNPHAILDTIGVIGTNSLNFSGHEKWLYTLACISVSCIWFLSLAITGYFFHKLDKTGKGIQAVNKISAIIIWSVGLYIARQLFISI